MARKQTSYASSSHPADDQDLDLRDFDDVDRDSYDRSRFGDDDEHMIFGLDIPSAGERPPAYGQGIVFALIIAAALLLAAIVAIGDGDGSMPPMLQRSSALLWIVSGLALVLAAAGAQYSEIVARRALSENLPDAEPVLPMTMAWALPFVSVFAAALLVATYHNRWILLLGPLLALLGMIAAFVTRDLYDEAEDTGIRTASYISSLVSLIIAFFAFGAIHLNKFSSGIAVPLVAIISFILLLEALERTPLSPTTRLLHAGIGTWIMAVAMMALNWWPITGWPGGALLISIFYIVYGLLMANAEQRVMDRRRLIETVGVGSAFMIIIAFFTVFR